MKLLSVNVGKPRTVEWKGRAVTTGIFKEPVSGRVAVRKLNLDGDEQADLSVHGGPDKAVYLYPSEHYPYWRQEFPDMDLPWGMFGENLTSEGLLEDAVNIGDRFRIGSAELMAVQPRMPCYKLGIRFGRDDIIKRFMASGRSGIYFAVLKEGGIEVGDSIEVISRDPNGVTLSDVVRLFGNDRGNTQAIRRAINVTALPENLRDYFSQQIK
jgi:MOSC domain-containing protein YiiM